jgi:hypothetical protein
MLANLREYGTEVMDSSEDWMRDVTRFAVRCCTEGVCNSDRVAGGQRGPVTLLTPEALAIMFTNDSGEHFVFLGEILQLNKEAFSESNWNDIIGIALLAKAPPTRRTRASRRSCTSRRSNTHPESDSYTRD